MSFIFVTAVTIHSDFGAQENKLITVSTFSPYVTISTFPPFICHEVMRPDAMIFVFGMLNFKPTFSLSSFIFFKRLFSSASLSATKVVSYKVNI